MTEICQVCGKPGRRWRGLRRILCPACAQAARSYSNRRSLYDFGFQEGSTDHITPPKDIALPNDHNYDSWTGKNRRLEE